ncbi:MAG: MFS transporter [Firmicutes bacterium]|nr:MFS transporter [Bacillota bacterium]
MKQLTKKGEPLYGFAAFGPNLLMILMSAYIFNALIAPIGIDPVFTFIGAPAVAIVLFGILSALAQVIDGFLDFPLSVWLQNMHSKFGRHRTALVFGMVPMILAYIAILFPITSSPLANTFYIIAMFMIFFLGYTLTLITYYSSYAEITPNEKGRIRLSSWKSIWDVVGFAIAYALVPLIVGFGQYGTRRIYDDYGSVIGGEVVPPTIAWMNIQTFVLMMVPLFLTMIIPLFMIKNDRGSKTSRLVSMRREAESVVNEANKCESILEDEKNVEVSKTSPNKTCINSSHPSLELSQDTSDHTKDFAPEPKEKQTLKNAVKTVLKNKQYRSFLYVLLALQFGLQLFLSTQFVFANVNMGLSGFQVMLVNVSAFGPVPFMLWIFNKIQRKKGIRFSFRLSLISFVVSMTILSITLFTRRNVEPWVNLIIGIVSGLIASFSIGTFFAMLYTIPSQIGTNGLKKTGRNNTSMMFAVQGVSISIVTAISVSLLWTIGLSQTTLFAGEYVYQWVYGAYRYVYVDGAYVWQWVNGTFINEYGVNISSVVYRPVYNFGGMYGIALVMPIVALSALLAFFLAKKIPKSYEMTDEEFDKKITGEKTKKECTENNLETNRAELTNN